MMTEQEIRETITNMINENKEKKKELSAYNVELSKKMSELCEAVRENEENDGRWKPKLQETYYYIGSEGRVFSAPAFNDDMYTGRYSVGNCFKTYKEAEFEAKRLKVIAKMKEYTLKPSDNRLQNICMLGYFNGVTPYYVTKYSALHSIFTDMLFSSYAQAEQCIKEVGEDNIKKYYFRIKE